MSVLVRQIGKANMPSSFYFEGRIIIMIQAYSLNVEVGADGVVPFNNIKTKKGCTVTSSGVGTFDLNKAGVYNVHIDGVSGTSTTVQLYKDGVAMPEAQSTGTTLGFETLVQVDHNNCGCCCSSPVTIQLRNTTASTFDNVNIVVTKLC